MNLAKNKPVTALTNTAGGTNPSNVNDGNIDNVWWSYQGSPTHNTFIVDLGSSYSIGRISVIPGQTHGFTISTSDDGSTYTPRYSSPWASTSVHVTPVTVAADGAYTARYIKYDGYASWAQYVGLYEIEVHEWLPSLPSPPPGANGVTNLALNRPTALEWGTVLPANPPASAVDGSFGTWWLGNHYSGRPDDCFHKNAVWGRRGLIWGRPTRLDSLAFTQKASRATG